MTTVLPAFVLAGIVVGGVPLARLGPAGAPADTEAAGDSSGNTATHAGASAPAAAPSTMRIGGLPPFVAEDLAFRKVPADRLPLTLAPKALKPTVPVDGDGIVQYRHRTTGRLHDHPVVQARHIVGWLASYRQTSDRRYLDLAERHGRRLLENATRHRGALFHPNPFDFALHGGKGATLKGPWYSAMSQGEVLAALVRLGEVTGDARWRDAARDTFRSFTIPRQTGKPWVVEVDREGHLLLEEYADDHHPDRAYNGHNFALFGIHEYWQATGDPQAAAIGRGAATTTLAYARRIRVPGELSRYCLAHDVRSEGYHGVHIRQLYALTELTGDTRFAQWADRFLQDAPGAYGGGPGRVAAGRHLLLRRAPATDPRARVVGSDSMSLDRAAPATFDRRQSIPGRDGVWLRLGKGPHRGLWLREGPRAHVSGPMESYRADRPVRFAAGTYTGLRVRGGQGLRQARTVTFSAPSTARSSGRVTIEGRSYVILRNGSFAGLHVPLTSGVTPR